MPEVALRQVVKQYGDVTALGGVDLTADDGELLTVVGPSGCGKTTALRIVAGLESVDAGSVTIGERDVTDIDAGERNIAMVFQNHALFPHLTVAENISFGLRARRAPVDFIERRVRDAATVVGCAHLLERRPDQISGGERQRVALARGIVRRPDVFLLDEPFSNLDAQLRVTMRRELRRLHNEIGGTMIHVTHDQVEALTLGDRVAVMSGGQLQQLATPDEVYRRPANRFVATFVGSPAMNLISGMVSGGAVATELGDLPLPPDGNLAEGRKVDIGVRPEHLVFVGADGGVAGRVGVVEVAGNDAHVQVTTSGVELMVTTLSETRPQPGSLVAVRFDPDRMYVFDAETGAALR